MTRLSQYDAGRYDAYAEAWAAATAEQHWAACWAAKTSHPPLRAALEGQADAAAGLAARFHGWLCISLDEAEARRRCLDAARTAADRWMKLRADGEAFQAARRAEAASASEVVHA